MTTIEARHGWIGVDLDGTLAVYSGWKGPTNIGAPVPAMLERVKAWLAAGQEVKIFTARVACFEPYRSEVIKAVHEWLESHGLPRLDVTNVKDMLMLELWDDRAVQVEKNTGRDVASVYYELAMRYQDRLMQEETTAGASAA